MINLDKVESGIKDNSLLKPAISLTDKVIKFFKKWKGLVALISTKSMHVDSHDWVSEITQRGDAINSKNVPPDLRQVNPRTILTRSGNPTAGYTLQNDWSFGEDAAISQLYITSGIILMTVLNVFGITSTGSLPIASLLSLSGASGLIATAIGSILGLIFLYTMNMLGAFFKGCMYLVGLFILFTIINMETQSYLITIGAYTFPALLIWYMSYSVDRKRGFQLSLQAESHNGVLNEQFIEHDDTANPQVAQLRKVMEDTSPFVGIGISTGQMSRNGDPNAPDGGVEMGLSVKDAGQHIFIEGATGTGKSWLLNSLLARFYIGMLKQGGKFGAFIGCGKGELPYQLKSMVDQIIAPHLIKNLNFLTGLRPEQRMNILLAANSDKGDAGQNQIFKAGGMEVGYYSALTQDRLVEMKHLIDPAVEKISSSWNYWEAVAVKMLQGGKLDNNGQCISQPIIDLLKQHPNFGTDTSIDKIIVYINKMQKPDNRQLVDSFLANFISWTSPISQNTRLYDWNDSETSDIDIYDILLGKIYGLALKFEEYGVAGAIITQFIKASLFNRLALRDDGWRDDITQTDVLMVLDECQDIVNDDDVSHAQKARSRGLLLIYATQHKTNLENKLGEKASEALMLSFLNKIQLRTGDQKSIDFLKHALGKIRLIISSAMQGNPIDFAHTNQIAMRNPEFNSNHPEAHFIKFNGSKVKATNKIFGGFTKEGKRVSSLDESQQYATYKYHEDSPVRDVLTPEIIKSLDIPHHAVVSVQRGGMPRNDVVKVYGMSSKDVAIAIENAKNEMLENELLNLKKVA